MAKRSRQSTGHSAQDKFQREIEQLLAEVPAEQWDDSEVRGVLYEFVPWHKMSSITLQTRDDDPRDIGSWKYYFSADSDGSLIEAEFAAWENEETNKRLLYHRLLLEAAEALLSIDFSKHINPELPTPVLNLRDWTAISDDGFCLNKTFYLQVYDPDESFRFNYCEYVLARRHEAR
ncbi:MAG: hypothetical protein U0840_27540 [Gemmataceae bacterium]